MKFWHWITGHMWQTDRVEEIVFGVYDFHVSCYCGATDLIYSVRPHSVEYCHELSYRAYLEKKASRDRL